MDYDLTFWSICERGLLMGKIRNKVQIKQIHTAYIDEETERECVENIYRILATLFLAKRKELRRTQE